MILDYELAWAAALGRVKRYTSAQLAFQVFERGTRIRIDGFGRFCFFCGGATLRARGQALERANGQLPVCRAACCGDSRGGVAEGQQGAAVACGEFALFKEGKDWLVELEQ